MPNGALIGYSAWCYLAPSLHVFLGFHAPPTLDETGQNGYQGTNFANGSSEIPESQESLARANVSGIRCRGNPG